jgi:hypothetical protein
MTATAFPAFYRDAAPVSGARAPLVSRRAAGPVISTPAPGTQRPEPQSRLVTFLGDAMATWATAGRLMRAD